MNVNNCKGLSIYELYVDELDGKIIQIKAPHKQEFIEVVRCKDCIHYYADPWGYGNCVFEGGVSRRTKESDYCSWGERRDEDETHD